MLKAFKASKVTNKMEEFLSTIKQCDEEIARWTGIRHVAVAKLNEARRSSQNIFFSFFFEAKGRAGIAVRPLSGRVGLFSSYDEAKKYLPSPNPQTPEYNYNYIIEAREGKNIDPRQFEGLDECPVFPHEKLV